VGHVREDVADLAFDVVAVLLEQLQYPSDQRLCLDYCLDLSLAARRNVRQYPAGLSSDHLLVVVEYFLQKAQNVVRE
jgi:hypothetical protein